MRDNIRSRQKCPACGRKGQYTLQGSTDDNSDLACACGKFVSNKPEIIIRWEGRVYQIICDHSGNRLESYPHAKRSLGLIRAQIEQGTFIPGLWASKKANKLICENYIAQNYLNYEKNRLVAKGRASWHKKRGMAKHLAWFNGRNIRDIKTGHVEDFAALPCLTLALAPKTLADLMIELRHIFRRAVAREDIESAPQVPAISVPQKPITWINPEQQARVVEKIPAPHRPIFLFLFTYGCRVAEACALCWDMIDLANGVFSLARTFSRRRLVEKTKTNRVNVLPIVNDFAAYLESIPPGILATPVFKNPEADHNRNPTSFYMPDFLNAVWAPAVAAAGLPPIALKNGTRHSRGMQAVNLQGWNLEAVRRLFGHTSQAHTRKYAQAETGLLKDLLEVKPQAKAKIKPILGQEKNKDK